MKCGSNLVLANGNNVIEFIEKQSKEKAISSKQEDSGKESKEERDYDEDQDQLEEEQEEQAGEITVN